HREGNLVRGGERKAFAGNICQVLLMVLLVILISLGNLVSLLVFFRIRQFRTSQGYLRASLALADLAVGLLGVPYSIYREVSQLAYGAGEEIHLFEKPACFVSGVVFASCTFVSISTILLLSVERSVAVLKPLHRKVVITKRRTVGLILASWAVSFCMALIPLLSSPNISLQYNSCSKMCNYAFTEDKLTTSHWNIMLLYPIFDFSVLSGAFIVNAVTFLAIHRYCKKRKQLGTYMQHSVCVCVCVCVRERERERERERKRGRAGEREMGCSQVRTLRDLPVG
uniref:G-protein coupled receptors family 1 profile domain-containing protein n=1 Tax=Salvator merianae TaxID=96440 RepID=A0A8D0B1U3_SALMN